MMVAAAGPAMKLAQSITSRSLNRFAGIFHSQPRSHRRGAADT
jgi:hypothetical protein